MLTKIKNLLRNLQAMTADPEPPPPPEPKTVPAAEVIAFMLERWLTAPEIRTVDGKRCVMDDHDKCTINATIRFLKELHTLTQPKEPAPPGISLEEAFAMKAAQKTIQSPVAAAQVPSSLP